MRERVLPKRHLKVLESGEVHDRVIDDLRVGVEPLKVDHGVEMRSQTFNHDCDLVLLDDLVAASWNLEHMKFYRVVSAIKLVLLLQHRIVELLYVLFKRRIVVIGQEVDELLLRQSDGNDGVRAAHRLRVDIVVSCHMEVGICRLDCDCRNSVPGSAFPNVVSRAQG